MRKTHFAFLLIFCFLANNLLQSQTFNQAYAQRYLDHIDRHNQSLLSIEIRMGDETLFEKSIGWQDLDNGDTILANKNTRYHIGSLTKTFTAAMVLQLIESKKLSLHEKLSRFFPQIPGADSIEIIHLLQHKSGLYNFTNVPDYLSWNTQTKSRDAIIKVITSQERSFPPGTKTEYSNSNFVLLGYIIEELDNTSYAEALEKRILKKAGLKNTSFGYRETSAHEAYSFTKMGIWIKNPTTHPDIPHGAGAIVSTTRDLCTFMDALFSGKIINKSSLDKMLSFEDGYGLGIFEINHKGKLFYGHGGAIDGFNAYLLIDPTTKTSFAICSNGSVMPVSEIRNAMLDIYLGQEPELPSFSTIELDDKQLAKFEGVFSSADFPLKITFIVRDGKLMGQATGQMAFPLEAVSNSTFVQNLAGIRIEFSDDGKSMILKQGGGAFNFIKD